ncbi:MAG: 50S ribosomal protein L13 [Actinobacteria bacterium]|nr:50S ribosomal protein L13 [Actinomycetota bacterium]MCL5446574.1 50S ribosomal protein L13 [Actinomycetota bacterium]
MVTYTPSARDIEHRWYVVDADGMVLGRMASEVARLLRGKHKPIFTPNLDTGDNVIVVNASKVSMTASKAEKLFHYTHSGYPGGLRSYRYSDLLKSNPEEVVRMAVRGMLPKGRLGRRQLGKLHVYRGGEHPHQAQKPESLELSHVKVVRP